MSGRRSLKTWEQRISRQTQFWPGHMSGRVDSAQPIRRLGGSVRRPWVAQMGAAEEPPPSGPTVGVVTWDFGFLTSDEEALFSRMFVDGVEVPPPEESFEAGLGATGTVVIPGGVGQDHGYAVATWKRGGGPAGSGIFGWASLYDEPVTYSERHFWVVRNDSGAPGTSSYRVNVLTPSASDSGALPWAEWSSTHADAWHGGPSWSSTFGGDASWEWDTTLTDLNFFPYGGSGHYDRAVYWRGPSELLSAPPEGFPWGWG